MKTKTKPVRNGTTATKARRRVTSVPHAKPADSNAGLLTIQRILVPTDFSACAKKALQYAIAFAKQFNSTLILVHVVRPYFPVPELGAVDYGVLEAQMLENAEKEMADLQNLVTAEGLKVEKVLQVGVPFREIDLAARESNADLIIISTHGHTGLRHVFMGGTAEQVVRYAPCPALVVREHEHEFVKA